MNGWSAITTVRMASKDRDEDSGVFIFSFVHGMAPQLAATPWGGSPPRPLCQKIYYSDCTENCPLCPLRAPRRFRNPKIRQQLGAQPTPRFRVMIDAMDRRRDRCSDRPIAVLRFCYPQFMKFINSRGRLGPAKSDGSAEGAGKAGEMKTEKAAQTHGPQ